MVEFKLGTHSFHNRVMVEIFDDGILIGAIYPDDGGIKVASKFPIRTGDVQVLGAAVSLEVKIDAPTKN